MSTVIGFIVNNWRSVSFVIIVIGIIAAIRIYGDRREEAGYRDGAADSTEVWSQRYNTLLLARTEVDSMLTIDLRPVPPVTGIAPAKPHHQPDLTKRLDSAYQAGRALGEAEQRRDFDAKMEAAALEVDTTQVVEPDSVAVRTQANIVFNPLDRQFYWWIQSSPIIDRELLIRKGYILPPEVIRYDWAVELTLGSSVRSPMLRVSPSLWYESWGIGADFEPRQVPVFKGGIRFQF